MIEKANEILHPYVLDVSHVAWNSVYEVGHRLTSRFDDVLPDELGTRTPRVFIAGDACHTHSAKAGQGMNVSMQDGWNLGWKLGHVLDGRSPESLLSTYSAERQVVAQNLIDFDKEWSTLMATKPEDLPDPTYARGLLRAHRRVPGRVHDRVRALDDRRHARASAARHRIPDRQAIQVGSGHPGLRRATTSTSDTRREPTGAGASTCSLADAPDAGEQLDAFADWMTRSPSTHRSLPPPLAHRSTPGTTSR